MGEKDITEKLLEEHNDVFADIVNVLLFKGKRIIKEESLSGDGDISQYKIENEIHEQERDVSKIWNKSENVVIAMYGLENQTKIDKEMPFRVIGYDGARYRGQVNMFTSDFKIVADYFVQMRKNKDYQPSRETIKHVDEVLKLMSVLTKDDRFLKAQQEGEVKNMCEVLDRVENRGIAKGLAQGLTQGLAQGLTQGLAQGIRATIEIAKKYGAPKESLIEEIKEKYSLSDDKAKEELDKYYS